MIPYESYCTEGRTFETIQDGTAGCFCLDGYEPMEGTLLPNQYCLDIDECLSLKDPCPPNHRCQNMEGYFKCIKEGPEDAKFSPENYYLTGSGHHFQCSRTVGHRINSSRYSEWSH